MSGLHFAGLVRLSSLIEIGLHFAGLVHLSSWLGPDCMHVAFPASQQGISFADTTLFLAHWVWTSLCRPCPPVFLPWSRLKAGRIPSVAARHQLCGHHTVSCSLNLDFTLQALSTCLPALVQTESMSHSECHSKASALLSCGAKKLNSPRLSAIAMTVR